MSPLYYGSVERYDEFAEEDNNSVRNEQNSDSAEDEKDTVSPEAKLNADDAPNSQIVDDVDCYDLCDVFGEEEATEDNVVFSPQQNSAAPTKDTPAAAEAVPSDRKSVV